MGRVTVFGGRRTVADTLAGQHAFITGGGSGIGLACARLLLADGACVTLVGRSGERLDAAMGELGAGERVAVAALDVADEGALAEALAQADARAPLTLALANAGTGDIAPLTVTDSATWERVLRVNLDGTYHLFKHAATLISRNGGGAMAAVSSIAGVRTHRFMHAYCASKAAVDMLVRTSADELGAAGVRVNSVCPGLVDTEIAAGLFATDDVHADYLACTPLGRTGEPDDIARALRFLLGPESSWITGINLSVDGGQHLRRGPNYDTFARALAGDDIAEGRL